MFEDELDVIRVQGTILSDRKYTLEETKVINQYQNNQSTSIMSAGVAGTSLILGIVGLIIKDVRLVMAFIPTVIFGPFSLYANLEAKKYEQDYRSIMGLPAKEEKVITKR